MPRNPFASSHRLLIAPLALCISSACQTPHDSGQSFPAGSEKAVSVACRAVPGAKVAEVTKPVEFGAEAADGSPLFWVVKLTSQENSAARERSLSVTPEGVIILLPQEVSESELPQAIAVAATKAAAGGKILHRERQETRATLKYAALDKPEVQYVVEVASAAGVRRLEMTADGKTIDSRQLGAENSEEQDKTPASANATPTMDGEYPAEAAAAVLAVKTILPHVTIKGVEEVGFIDGTGQMSVLNYEVEFFEDGVEKEWNASPDGIVITVPHAIESAALPAAIRAAVAKEAGAKIRKAVKQETRAGLKFVALPEAKVIYEVEFEQNGKSVKRKWNPDGSKVEEVDVALLMGGKSEGSEEEPPEAKTQGKQ